MQLWFNHIFWIVLITCNQFLWKLTIPNFATDFLCCCLLCVKGNPSRVWQHQMWVFVRRADAEEECRSQICTSKTLHMHNEEDEEAHCHALKNESINAWIIQQKWQSQNVRVLFMPLLTCVLAAWMEVFQLWQDQMHIVSDHMWWTKLHWTVCLNIWADNSASFVQWLFQLKMALKRTKLFLFTSSSVFWKPL